MKFRLAEQLLNEGTWSLPFSQDKVDELANILSKPINNHQAEKKLYNIYGDDELYDKLIEDNEDVRPIIKSSIKELINSYESNISDFKEKCPEDILNKLKELADYSKNEQLIEYLDIKQLHEKRIELGRLFNISANSIILGKNGIFEIHNIDEIDSDRIINRAKMNTKLINNIHKYASGYDFGHFTGMGTPKQKYTIRGQLSEI